MGQARQRLGGSGTGAQAWRFRGWGLVSRGRPGLTLPPPAGQFVPFRDYVDRTGNHVLSMARLARDVLAEIPDQLVSYMKAQGIRPRSPPTATARSPPQSPARTPPASPLHTHI